MFVPPEFILLVSAIWSFLGDWWWLVAPPLFLFLLRDFWLLYVRWKRFWGMEWLLLEIRLPQLVERTPKAMEQVFSGLHGMWSKPKVTQKYLRGEVPNWCTCEIVSVHGETKFYIRVLAKFRNLVEAHVWAQYPDAEIREADDYTTMVPRGIPNETWDLWGTEFKLSRPDAYPIRTYIEFEATVEEQRLDPLGAILEVMSSVGPGEHVWLQIVAEPVFDKWKEQGDALIAKLIGRQKPKKRNLVAEAVIGTLSLFIAFVEDFLNFFFGGAPAEGKPVKIEREPPLSLMQHLSPAEKDVVEAIGRNIAKIGFRTGLRVVYAARRDVFNSAVSSALYGAIRQFNTQNLNGFQPDKKVLPSVYYLFPKQRNYFRKRRLDWRYRIRFFTKSKFIFNVEELATIFHFPGTMVAKAPSVSRIEAKRGEPPATLPTA